MRLPMFPGSSPVFLGSLVSYSSQIKERFGVKQEIIKKYTVYSRQVAEEMAKQVAKMIPSTWAIGITGYLGDKDPDKTGIEKQIVFYTIYYVPKRKTHSFRLQINPLLKRQEKKEIVVTKITERMIELIQKRQEEEKNENGK